MAVRRHTANMGASRPDTAGPGWSFLRRVVAAIVVVAVVVWVVRRRRSESRTKDGAAKAH